jgi:F-type H+-transporting ATPase subunit epsilon
MADTIQLEIVTPERLVVKDSVDDVQIPGVSGYLGILPGHAPLITEIGVGEISYHSSGRLSRLAVAWGFAEILPDKVTILAETAEKSEEIDVQRAQAAMARAEEVLRNSGTAGNPQAQAAFERAKSRIEVAGKV